MDRECEVAKELMLLHRLGKLTAEQKQELNTHLFFCTECMFQMVLADDRVKPSRGKS